MNESSHLAAQYAVGRVLTEAETFEDAAPRLVEAMLEVLGWELGNFWVVDDASRVVRVTATAHRRAEELDRFAATSRSFAFRPGEGLPGRVWLAKAPAWVTDIASDPGFTRRAAAIEAGLRSAFAFPAFRGNTVLGVIELFSVDGCEPDAALLDVMTAIGGQVGQFIERTRATRTLRASEARKSAVLEAAVDAIITMDHKGLVLEFNPAAEQIFGYSRDEVIGQEMCRFIIPEELRDRHREGLARYIETGEGPVVGRRIEVPAQGKDGRQFPAELAITRVDVPGPPIFTGYLRDITQRKRAEAEREYLLALERDARAQLEDATARLRALQALTETALQHTSLDVLAQQFLARISELLHVDNVALFLLTDDHKQLVLNASLGPLYEGQGSSVIVPVGEGIAGQIAQTGSPVIGADIVASNGGEVTSLPARSVVGVPLMAQGALTGVLQVSSDTSRSFTNDDVHLLKLAADRIAVGIERVRLYEREHRIAESLQRSLLPGRLPRILGVTVAVRYEPGGPGLEVGGDWYDVLELPGDRLAVAVGDVVGRGLRAAAAMGQLRNVVRAYAFENHPPHKVLDLVNRLSERLDRADMATLVYLVIDPADKMMCMSVAGHPPPVLVTATGRASFLEGGRSVPLGALPDSVYPQIEVPVELGSTLLLYTDGLVERRGQSIDEGLQRLQKAASEAPRDLELMCDYIMTQLADDESGDDDVALIAVRLANVAQRPLQLRLPAAPESIATLRGALRRWLQEGEVAAEDIFDIAVAACEASANAIEHAYGPGDAHFEVDAALEQDRCRVVVRDFGSWRASRSVDRGRGIHIMRSLMDEVDIVQSQTGTEVALSRRVARGE